MSSRGAIETLPLERLARALDAPRHMSPMSAWIEHIPFAMALVDLLRPDTLVELGTHMGDSYCAFCQAVDTLHLPTRCTAVDTWKGDPQSGHYDENVLRELQAYHDPLYGRFARLLQATFDEAAAQFAPGSIDLLHIDGLHAYDAVRQDVDKWLPKLSRRGVLLLHDTQVREPGFGVWRVWEELLERGVGHGGGGHFEFTHGYGLGVLAVGEEVAEGVAEFLRWAGRNAEGARAFFAALGNRLQLARGLRQLTPLIERQYQSLAALAAHTRYTGLPPAPAAADALGHQGDLKAWLDNWRHVLTQENNLLTLCPPRQLSAKEAHPAATTGRQETAKAWAAPNAGAKCAVSVVIPTRDAGPRFEQVLDGLKRQCLKDAMEVIVVDSGSRDDTVRRARAAGAQVITIAPESFNHGLTRNLAIKHSRGEIVYLQSQDAIPADAHVVENLRHWFEDPQVAGVFARQLPCPEHDVLIARAVTNWVVGSPQTRVSCISDRAAYEALSPIQRYRRCAFDNVCAAVRRSVWREFPFAAVPFGEDLDWSKRVLEAGWKICYEPSAMVYHSHDRGIRDIYRRTYLCHRQLSRLFGLEYCRTRRQLVRQTLENSWHDLAYVWKYQPGLTSKIALSCRVPGRRFADFLGRYHGARDEPNAGSRQREEA